MTPLEVVLTHQCADRCKPWAHAHVVWLRWGEDDFRRLDNELMRQRLILSSARPIRRDAAGPRPDDVCGSCWPWEVQWARRRTTATGPAATPGGDVAGKVRAGVGRDERGPCSGHAGQPARQLDLFTSSGSPRSQET